MLVDTAMILAAGRGQRMAPLTDHTPKPLLKVHQKPLIEYQIERICNVGIKNIVINTAYKGEQIRTFCGDGSQWGVHIQYSDENQALETAGGIKKALPLLGEKPFIVINSDIFCDIQLKSLMQPISSEALIHIMLVENPQHNHGGDFSFIKNIGCNDIEHSKNQMHPIGFGSDFTFSGCGLYHPQVFQDLKPGFQALRQVFEQQAAQGKLLGSVHRGYWYDIGTPERLEWINQQSVDQLGNQSNQGISS